MSKPVTLDQYSQIDTETTCSKDEFVEGIPMWKTYVEPDEFVITHPGCVLQPIFMWTTGNVTTAVQTGEDILKAGGIQNMLTWLEDANPFKQEPEAVILLGYHIMAVPENETTFEIWAMFGVLKENYIGMQEDALYEKILPGEHESAVMFRILGQKPWRLATLGLARKTFPTSLGKTSVTLDASISHDWLHRLFDATTQEPFQFIIRNLCVTIDPIYVSRMRQKFPTYQWVTQLATEQMRIASNDLTKKGNQYRAMASVLLEKTPPEELYNVTKMMLES